MDLAALREANMRNANFDYTRRDFLVTAAAAAGVTALPVTPARAAAKYTRYNVTSPQGQKMLASYAKGVEAMLKLPADHPQNWFRNAFIHLMDCPHGNWWFYVWHRGYLGFFERSIRALSGDDSFAIPYWDWTELPQIPDGMFNGALTPTDKAYEPTTGNLALFTDALTPPLTKYWNSLSPAQINQLNVRGFKTFQDLWNATTGYDPSIKDGSTGNQAFAVTCSARYLSRDNPKLDAKTAVNVAPRMVLSGLLPPEFNNSDMTLSFTSAKTPSHNSMPGGLGSFSTLEGFPHNKVHNYIGGVGRTDPGPYGNMTNNLSPIDPIFFLHHSNMDRLWDVWTRKQMRLKLPYLPEGQDLKTLSKEPFLFYVGGDGKYVGPTVAGDFLSTDVFDYDYQPGFGEEIVPPSSAVVAAARSTKSLATATIRANVASVAVPREAVQSHLSGAPSRRLMAQIVLQRPSGPAEREFDVLVDAPDGVTQAAADSPYYAGTFAFFGSMMQGMKMSHDVAIAFPLPDAPPAFTALGAARQATVKIRLVPSHGLGVPGPTLRSVSVRAL
jgi:tyrosinase